MPRENQNMQRWICQTQAKTSSKHLKVWKQPKLKDRQLSKWNFLVQDVKNLKLGEFTDIGAFTLIGAKYGVTIEDNVQIGPHCAILSASTIDDKYGQVILKNNCKIGSHTTIMPNVTVGHNSIVGAHSFVNKNIPANQVWFGVPAKFYKKI
jgi:acetyltransferase-like isoleucine patch superfamily enzyme